MVKLLLAALILMGNAAYHPWMKDFYTARFLQVMATQCFSEVMVKLLLGAIIFLDNAAFHPWMKDFYTARFLQVMATQCFSEVMVKLLLAAATGRDNAAFHPWMKDCHTARFLQEGFTQCFSEVMVKLLLAALILMGNAAYHPWMKDFYTARFLQVMATQCFSEVMVKLLLGAIFFWTMQHSTLGWRTFIQPGFCRWWPHSASQKWWSSCCLGRYFFGQCSIPPLDEGLSYSQVSAGDGHTLLLRSDGQAVAWGDIFLDNAAFHPWMKDFYTARFLQVMATQCFSEVMVKLLLGAIFFWTMQHSTLGWRTFIQPGFCRWWPHSASQKWWSSCCLGRYFLDNAAFHPWMKDFHTARFLQVMATQCFSEVMVKLLLGAIFFWTMQHSTLGWRTFIQPGFCRWWPHSASQKWWSSCCLGRYFFGQCSIPPLDEGLSYSQVSAGDRNTVLLRSDGQAVAWGDIFLDNAAFHPWMKDFHTARFLQVMATQCFSEVMVKLLLGAIFFGTMQHSTLGWRTFIQPGFCRWWPHSASQKWWSSCCLGRYFFGQCSIPPLDEGLSYSQVSAGDRNTVLLRSDGQAVACGSNPDGRCSIPSLSSWRDWLPLSFIFPSYRYICDSPLGLGAIGCRLAPHLRAIAILVIPQPLLCWGKTVWCKWIFTLRVMEALFWLALDWMGWRCYDWKHKNLTE